MLERFSGLLLMSIDVLYAIDSTRCDVLCACCVMFGCRFARSNVRCGFSKKNLVKNYFCRSH